jgi:hypothetical protein
MGIARAGRTALGRADPLTRGRCIAPTLVQPDERMGYARARASLAMSSSQGPGKRPRWVPPIM